MDFRLDRLATLYLVSPLKRFAPEKRLSIPILMYHSIADEDESRMRAYYRTSTSPKAFAAQMEYLHQSGYQTCNPTQAITFLQSDTGPATNRVVITFDDGYGDFYREAFPVLNRFGFTATMFLPTFYIGESTLQFKGRDCLTWSEVRELQKHGISFGSHTATHPKLHSLDKKAIEKEIVSSKRVIEEETGCAVASFAYPYAFPQADAGFKKMLRETLCSAGYENGVCTIVGTVGRDSDPFCMERLPVNTLDDTLLLEAKLAGAYNWISKSQHIVKMARGRTTRIYGPW